MGKLTKNLIGLIISLYISLFRIAPDVSELINMYNSGDPQFTMQIIIRILVFIFVFLFVTRIMEAIHTVVYTIKRIQTKKSQGYNIWDANTYRDNDTQSKLNGGIDDKNKWDFKK